MSVVVVGGCGHVGLPLAITLADAGLHTVAFDIDAVAVDVVNGGTMPFLEAGAHVVLTRVLANGSFLASTSPETISVADVIVVVIGTPVDDHLNPDPNEVVRALEECIPFMRDGQLVVLRSTVFPGVTARVEQTLHDRGIAVDVTFCPERIAEGQAMSELSNAAADRRGEESAVGRSAQRRSSRAWDQRRSWSLTEEAELAKLFTNTWRYIKFAAANQFYVMANNRGLDF